MARLPAVAEVAVAEDEAGKGVEYIHAEGPVEEEQELGDPQMGIVGRLWLGGCVGIGWPDPSNRCASVSVVVSCVLITHLRRNGSRVVKCDAGVEPADEVPDHDRQACQPSKPIQVRRLWRVAPHPRRGPLAESSEPLSQSGGCGGCLWRRRWGGGRGTGGGRGGCGGRRQHRGGVLSCCCSGKHEHGHGHRCRCCCRFHVGVCWWSHGDVACCCCEGGGCARVRSPAALLFHASYHRSITPAIIRKPIPTTQSAASVDPFDRSGPCSGYWGP